MNSSHNETEGVTVPHYHIEMVRDREVWSVDEAGGAVEDILEAFEFSY